jgi:hypothetical protein
MLVRRALVSTSPTRLILAAIVASVAIGLMAIGLEQSAATAAETGVEVSSTEEFTDTHVALTAGEKVTVAAEGKVDVCSPGSCLFEPQGEKLPGKTCLSFQYTKPHGLSFPAPGLPCYSLIARIGSGPSFTVGKRLSFKSPVSGELFLGINDDFRPDNTGHWTAKVTTP